MKTTAHEIMQAYRTGRVARLETQDIGLWRDARPVWDKERCFKCGICWISCPDAAIVRIDEGYFDCDPRLCKGCGVCARECMNDAIAMTAELKQG